MVTPVTGLPKAHDGKALRYILDAWEDALDDGIQRDELANAALFAALSDLIAHYGEATIIKLTNSLSERIISGEFTLERTLQ